MLSKFPGVSSYGHGIAMFVVSTLPVFFSALLIAAHFFTPLFIPLVFITVVKEA
jgi:hypothetical protein